MVASAPLPFTFGSPHPTVAVVEQDGLFRLRDLVIDAAEAEAARAAAFAQRAPWMPEHYYALGKPTGTIHCEATTREALVEKLWVMPWPSSW